MMHVVFRWCTNKKNPSQKEKNQFGITPTTKLTIGITIFIFITHYNLNKSIMVQGENKIK
jgi:hypothetical protein